MKNVQCPRCGAQFQSLIPQSHVETRCRNMGGMMVPSAELVALGDYIEAHARRVSAMNEAEDSK